MTRPFFVQNTCAHCGQQTSAETAFGRWMRNHPKLDSRNGIVRTDTDHTILRYMTHAQGRDVQLLMDIEVKEFGASPRDDQRDIQSFKHQLIFAQGKNMYGARTVITRELKSVMNNRVVEVRYLGYHLLQFQKTNPLDSDWIKWDHKIIDEKKLVGILAIELDPFNFRTMYELLRNRHAPSKQLQLKLFSVI